MIIFAKTNGNLYNMEYVQNFKKVGDMQISFLMTNGRLCIENYNSKDDRDNVYDGLVEEFVKDLDGDKKW